jgi:hypothetical protein
MSFFDGNYDSNKDFFEEEAEEVLQNYINTWNGRPGSVKKAIFGIPRIWIEKMLKADLAMSQFLSWMRIKPETKEKLNTKFQEIYPEMLKFLNLDYKG